MATPERSVALAPPLRRRRRTERNTSTRTVGDTRCARECVRMCPCQWCALCYSSCRLRVRVVRIVPVRVLLWWEAGLATFAFARGRGTQTHTHARKGRAPGLRRRPVQRVQVGAVRRRAQQEPRGRGGPRPSGIRPPPLHRGLARRSVVPIHVVVPRDPPVRARAAHKPPIPFLETAARDNACHC